MRPLAIALAVAQAFAGAFAPFVPHSGEQTWLVKPGKGRRKDRNSGRACYRGSRGGNNGGLGYPHQNYQECHRRQLQMRRGLLDFSASTV